MELQGRDLQIATTGDDVQLLQFELRQLGYDIPIQEYFDATFAQGTERAVRAFQQRMVENGENLEIDGVVGSETASLINQFFDQQQTFRLLIYGVVTDRSTGQAVPDLSVNVSAIRDNVPILLGTTTTTETGLYSITYELPRPTFDPFRAITAIPGIEATPIRFEFQLPNSSQVIPAQTTNATTLGRGDSRIDLDIDLPQQNPMRIIQGTITHYSSVEGLLVEAFDRDLAIGGLRDQSVGTALANNQGFYRIAYSPEDILQEDESVPSEWGTADLFIRVTPPDARDTILGTSPITYNAPEVTTIDLALSDTIPHLTPAEFDRYQAFFDDRELSIASLSPDIIDFVVNEGLIPPDHLAYLIAAARLSQQTQIRADAFYGIARDRAFEELTLEAVLALGYSGQEHSLEDAIQDNTISLLPFSPAFLQVLRQLRFLADEQAPPEPAPVFEQNEILTLDQQANQTPGALQSSNADLYNKLQAKAIGSIQQSLVDHFKDASYELRYFLNDLALESLVTTDETISAQVSRALRESQLSTTAKRAGQVKINTWDGPERVEDVLQPDLPLENNPLFSDELRQAGVLSVSGFAQIPSATTNRLIGRNLSLEAVSPELLDELVAENILSQPEAQRFGVNANLYTLLEKNSQLVSILNFVGTNEPISNLRELVTRSIGDQRLVTRSNWEDFLDAGNITPPQNTNRSDYAALFQKKLELLFPDDVLRALHQRVSENDLIRDLDRIEPLFENNERLFNGLPFSALSVGNQNPQNLAEIEAAHSELTRLANRYPGLELHAVLDDRELTAAAKATEVSRRVDSLERFLNDNADNALLSKDYSPGSDDINQLTINNLSSEDVRRVINNEKTDQAFYTLTQDIEHSILLKESGYTSILRVATDRGENIAQATGLAPSTAQSYLSKAQSRAFNTFANFASILDQINNPWRNSLIDNTASEVYQYLRRFEGYDNLFGPQDYCKCKHCQSIISPAAYFVDLMDFLHKNVTREHFSIDPLVSGSNWQNASPLDLRKRRPDLWHTLRLTCKCTDTLVPHLTIILEILENYIYRSTLDVNQRIHPLTDREVVETAVYRQLYTNNTINSLSQPFHLPLVELQTYLEHFSAQNPSITPSHIARTVLAYQDDSNDVIPQAELHLSRREYELIQAPQTDTDFLNGLHSFAVPVAEDSPPESKELLHSFRISRQELTALVKTQFVTSGGNGVSLVGRRTDGSVQINQEVVQGLNLINLDRMHRFVRLWRQLPWSMGELDQVLQHSYAANSDLSREQLPLQLISELPSLQQRLEVTIPELCALLHQIPTAGEPALFDQLFNPPGLNPAGEREKWTNSLNIRFQHPAYQLNLSRPDASVSSQHRLLAGLGLNDDELFQLIDHLKTPLGADEDSGTIRLTLASLSLLYRHSRLAKALKLSISELFVLLRLSTQESEAPEEASNYLQQFSDVQALVEFAEWQKGSGYTIQELAFLLGNKWERRGGEPGPAEISQRFINEIYAEQSLTLADTAFAYFDGVTEAQSRQIFEAEANSSLFIPAQTHQYRVLPEIDSATVSIEVPLSIRRNFDADQFGQLIFVLREIIAKYRQSDPTVSTPSSDQVVEISDQTIADATGLSLAQARVILRANSTIPEPAVSPIFEPVVNSSLYWLSANFSSASAEISISIPAGISLPNHLAQAYLRQFSASEIIAHLLARHFNQPVEKIKALSKLSIRTDLYSVYPEDSSAARNPRRFNLELTSILHGEDNTIFLERLINRLHRFTIWFKDKVFDAETINLVLANAGGSPRRIISHYRSRLKVVTLDNIKQIVILKLLLKTLKAIPDSDKAQDIFYCLQGFVNTEEGWRFLGDRLEKLSGLLGAEPGLITALNQKLNFPLRSSDPDNAHNRSLEAFSKLKTCIELTQFLGIGGAALPLMASGDFSYEDLTATQRQARVQEDYDNTRQAVAAIVTAIQTKHKTEKEQRKILEPFEDKIRERRRDVLTDYLIYTQAPEIFQTENDLYHYFLIDTELGGCARTSKVVAGISSLQLYIQRCLLNLEQSRDGLVHVLPEHIPSEEWVWRKNYRVWEANRKVFLYPENYIEPDLRDNKTPLFEELESTLLQQEINSQSVLDAYAKYMKGFEELASLKIAGAYHDRSNGADVLHLFGVTFGEPPEYYYRTIRNVYRAEESNTSEGIVWNSWQKVNLQIPAQKVSPIVFLGELHVFWVGFNTRPKKDLVNGNNRFTGYQHTASLQFSTLRLDGSWTTPQNIKLENNRPFSNGLGVVHNPISESEEITQFSNRFIFPPVSGRSDRPTVAATSPIPVEDIKKAFLNQVFEEIKEDRRVLEISSKTVQVDFEDRIGKNYREKNYREIDFTSQEIRDLFVPKYGEDIHVEPVDGYTLSGYQWNQIYPSQRGTQTLALNGFLGLEPIQQLRVNLDFYQLSISPQTQSYYTHQRNRLPNLKRLTISTSSGSHLISSGYVMDFYPGTAYADAVKIQHRQTDSLGSRIVDQSNIGSISRLHSLEMSIINGSLSDGVLDISNDLFYLHRFANTSIYILKRLGTTLSQIIGRTLFMGGIDSLLSIDFQQVLSEASLPIAFQADDIYNDAQKSVDKGMPDFVGPMGTYYREIFFHMPFLIANHLNSQGKYADAQRWYHYIYDPTSTNLPDDPARESDRVWQYIEFRNRTLQTLRQQLNDSKAINAYETDAFNPHAIARHRLGAYQKSIVMKYIDNLLDWGDSLFAQDTRESIHEATLLYIMALDILGSRPDELGDCIDDTDEGNRRSYTYDEIARRINSPDCSSFIREVGSLDGNSSSQSSIDYDFSILGAIPTATLNAINQAAISYLVFTGSQRTNPVSELSPTEQPSQQPHVIPRVGDIAPFLATSFLKQTCEFCIPVNPELLGYWDRVEDRLYKIRHCLNISGLRRELPLFAPEIDPRLLVGAKAAGVSLADVLTSASGSLPPYRFSFLIVKAKEYAGALQSFGAALLSALEKRDAEEMNKLRLTHQSNILKMTTRLRDQEINAAEASLAALNRRKDTITARRDYYQELIDGGLSNLEITQSRLKVSGHAMKLIALSLLLSAAPLKALPSIAGFSFSVPTHGVSESLASFGWLSNLLGDYSLIAGDLVGTHANYQRREQGWKFSRDQTNNELTEIEKQLVAADARLTISKKSKEIHEQSQTHLQEMIDFYEDKFTNLGLYTWLSTQLQTLYREAYQNAMAMARLVEQAYRFERIDNTTTLLQGNYWDGSHAGLLAGEQLLNDLRSIERRYMETHYRSCEIDQAFSLTQIDPAALITLKETGECSFSIPELYFDLFYPGHYRRRIKSARLTIPCITGPYTNVSATLTLTRSYMRKDLELGDSNLHEVPPTRTVSIATSTGQNDSGVFRLDFRDERYMPFEGAGAVSDWTLSLPKTFRQFDYQTINDVILHVSYTAEQDNTFRRLVEGDNAGIESAIRTMLQTAPLSRVFSLRQEFSNPFNRLIRSAAGQPVPLEITEKRFPIFLQGNLLSNLQITSAKIVLVTPMAGEEGGIGNFSLSIGNNELTSFTAEADFGGLPVANLDWSGSLPDTLLGEHTFVITDVGNLNPTDTTPADPSAIDPEKLTDILLFVEYGLAGS